jgi:hypothetical protein
MVKKQKRARPAGFLPLLADKSPAYDRTEVDAALDDAATNKKRKRRSPEVRVSCYLRMPSLRDMDKYICLKCGTRTLYPMFNVTDKIERSQKIAGRLRGLGFDITVDASAFCSKCTPMPSRHFLYWIIDGRRTKVSPFDCSLLETYVADRERCAGGKAAPSKLSPRLRKLLGTEAG